MLERFKQLVADYYNERAEKTDGATITADDVYVVWSCKTLVERGSLFRPSFN